MRLNLAIHFLKVLVSSNPLLGWGKRGWRIGSGRRTSMKSPRRWSSAIGSCSMRRPAKSRTSPKVDSCLIFQAIFWWSTDELAIV
jgi:hypothetical protein